MEQWLPRGRQPATHLGKPKHQLFQYVLISTAALRENTWFTFKDLWTVDFFKTPGLKSNGLLFQVRRKWIHQGLIKHAMRSLCKVNDTKIHENKQILKPDQKPYKLTDLPSCSRLYHRGTDNLKCQDTFAHPWWPFTSSPLTFTRNQACDLRKGSAYYSLSETLPSPTIRGLTWSTAVTRLSTLLQLASLWLTPLSCCLRAAFFVQHHPEMEPISLANSLDFPSFLAWKHRPTGSA